MQIDGTTAAIVTGGASGLGRASATALAKSGVKTTIFDWNEDGVRIECGKVLINGLR